MKIISWNVNGLRAVHNKNLFLPFVLREKPDILCLQEIKAQALQLPAEIAVMPGYHAYFSSPKVKKGYSGVALYSKTEPEKVEYGIGIPRFDDEGRILIAYYPEFTLLNIYFPNGGSGEERLKYKLDFYDAFLLFIDKLKKGGQKIIFCGDINTAHEAIDLARPKQNENNTGFLPEERAWIDEVIAHGYSDIFRGQYPTKKDVYTFWDMKTASRERNVGWRIDYFFISNNISPKKISTGVLSNVYGSDHCPISLLLEP
ncbi:MAG: exodeoxyribonuclease III [Candidatus Paceibacterota bacterium]|jgi:exodeoxyribonuclease-3|nr:exodeoxyribonuclease III [Candidatus Paceibacterota bacterium]